VGGGAARGDLLYGTGGDALHNLAPSALRPTRAPPSLPAAAAAPPPRRPTHGALALPGPHRPSRPPAAAPTSSQTSGIEPPPHRPSWASSSQAIVATGGGWPRPTGRDAPPPPHALDPQGEGAPRRWHVVSLVALLRVGGAWPTSVGDREGASMATPPSSRQRWIRRRPVALCNQQWPNLPVALPGFDILLLQRRCLHYRWLHRHPPRWWHPPSALPGILFSTTPMQIP